MYRYPSLFNMKPFPAIWPASKMTKEMDSDLCSFSTIINSPHKCNSSFWCQTTPAVFAG